MKKNKGITLIALVITIIVLMILAGVTISMSLNGGILEKANMATEEYKIAQIKEKIMLDIAEKIIQKNEQSLSNEELEEIIIKNNATAVKDENGKITHVEIEGSRIPIEEIYNGTITDDTIEDTVILINKITLDQTEISINLGETYNLAATIEPSNATNQNVTWSSNDTTIASVENGVITANAVGTAIITATAEDKSGISVSCMVTVLEKKPKVGDTVIYTPTVKTYNWQGKYAYSDPKTNIVTDTILNNAVEGENGYKITQWKVFSISSDEQTVELISADSTTGTVPLGRSQGYNNGVKLLNDACNALYGNSSKGIIGRSIKIEDIEERMTQEALTGENGIYNYKTRYVKYGEQLEEPLTAGQYPIIYGREKNRVIDGIKTTTGLGVSEQTGDFIGITDNGASDGRITASISINPIQSSWQKEISFMQTALKAPDGLNEQDGTINTNYKLLFPNGDSTDYYIASRGASVNYTHVAHFAMCEVTNKFVGVYEATSGSYDYGSTWYHPIRPIITLDASLIQKDTDGNWKVNI